MSNTPRSQTISARDGFVETQTIFEELTHTLPNGLVYANANRFGNVEFESWLRFGNVSRTLLQEGVVLGRYAADCCLETWSSYSLCTQNLLVAEQTAPWISDLPACLALFQTHEAAAIEIDRPCLLACRYGETTWGHWLCEILPKIVIAELSFPQLFTFVIPEKILMITEDRTYSTSVRESLIAYGINPSRILQVPPNRLFKFHTLFDVAGIRTDGFHPKVIEAMRSIVEISHDYPSSKRIALLRGEGERRSAHNWRELADFIDMNGYTRYDLNALPFLQQVKLFSGATDVIADLGSNLAGIIFSPKLVRVLSLAPAGWYDGYFTNLLQRLNASQADVRGASTYLSEGNVADSSYVVPISDVCDGLFSLATLPPAADRYRVSGVTQPRLLGDVIFDLRFERGGNAQKYFIEGWAQPEPHICWSIGKIAKLVVPDFPQCREDIWLEIEGIGFLKPPELPFKYLSISVNHILLETVVVSQALHVHVLVPNLALEGFESLEIVFAHDVSPSPSSMGSSLDTRQLGVGFSRIQIRMNAKRPY